MTLVIRMHVFSGVADPIWALSSDQAKELANMVAAMDATRPTAIRGLGYRGFSILDPEAEEGRSAVLSDFADYDPHSGSFVTGAQEIEEFLLWTGREGLDDEIAEHVSAAIENPMSVISDAAVSDISCPPCGGGEAPTYDPGYWNGSSARRLTNNCYNYANNKATNTFAQPGRGSGTEITALSCGGVQPASISDGLRSVPTFRASISSGWYVALVVWPGKDYHWYRQDSSGCWSHKPGRTPATAVDNRDQKLVDPRVADRGPYTSFCSYMVTNRTVRIA